jgi:hypothetical protein
MALCIVKHRDNFTLLLSSFKFYLSTTFVRVDIRECITLVQFNAGLFEMDRTCSTLWGDEMHFNFGRTARRDDSIGVPVHGGENNIGMDFKEKGCGHFYWINLTQDRDQYWTIVDTVMNFSYS